MAILSARFEGNIPLESQFNSSRFLQLPLPEQLLAREIINCVLRHLSLLDYLLEAVSSRPLSRIEPQALWILRSAAAQLRFMRVTQYAAVNEAVNLCDSLGLSRARGFVNGLLRSLLRQSPEPPAGCRPEDLAIAYSHPLWLVRRLIDRLGQEGAVQMMAQNNSNPLPVVWVNPFRIGLEEFCRELDRREIPCEVLSGLARAVRVEQRGFVRDPLYQGGCCFFMDPSSQAVAELGEIGGTRLLADLCAAPGGKTFILQSRRPPASLLVSADRHRGRLQTLNRRAVHLGMPALPLLQLDVSRPLPFRPRFDYILLDAPCSGLGTLRSNPDLRWFVLESDLPRHRRRQAAMLRNSFACLAPGGLLTYATCSTEPEENQEVVEPFLAEHPSARRETCGLEPAVQAHGGDGFFAVQIRRL